MSIRNELLEQILLAIETGGGNPQIVKDITQIYQQASPLLNTDVDSGIDPSLFNGNSEIAFTVLVQVNSSGNIYALSNQIDNNVLSSFPDIRYSRTSEFEGAGGDVFSAFWQDGTTGTLHYEIDTDGAGKTVLQAIMSQIKLDIVAG